MPFIVLAVGALMSLIGAYFAWTGSSVIQFERGWSAVIAGANLVTGGLVMMALGLLLRALGDLRKAIASATVPSFVAAPAMPLPLAPEAGLVAHRERQPHAEPAPAQPDPARPSEVAHATPATPAHATSVFATRVSATPVLAESLRPEPVPAPPPHVEPDDADYAEPLPAEDREPHRADAYADPADTQAYETEPPVPVPVDAHHGEAVAARDEPSVAEAAPPAEAHHPARAASESASETAPDTSPAMDDWLDRSFADIEREMAVPRERPPARLPRATPPARQAEPAHADTALMEPETVAEAVEAAHAPQDPAHGDAPAEVAPAVAEPTSAVIGRYESEGTSYVMYADGSIEAQSEAGVYRFASMTELKAFIEG